MTKKCSMIDIETIGERPTAAILSIAVVIFDLDNPEQEFLDEFVVYLDVKDQINRLNRSTSDSTIKWWKEQDKEIRDLQFSGKVKLEDGMNQLFEFLDKHACEWHWAKGTHFDMSILREAAQDSGLQDNKFFKEFWSYMCCATVGRLVADELNDKWFINNLTRHYNKLFGGSHDPLVDCYIQIEILKDCLIRED